MDMEGGSNSKITTLLSTKYTVDILPSPDIQTVTARHDRRQLQEDSHAVLWSYKSSQSGLSGVWADTQVRREGGGRELTSGGGEEEG